MNYKSNKWLLLRERILKRDMYMCQECKRYGKNNEGNIVHHIFPASDVVEYQYLKQNLITLCDKCHNEMHERKTGKLTAKGETLLERKKMEIERAWQSRSELMN